jgi:hypothetical protein
VLIDDLNSRPKTCFTQSKKIKIQEEDQDPVEEEQDPVGGFPSQKREKLSIFFQRLEGWFLDLKNTMPRKGKDETFDELVVQLGLQNRTYASTQW